MQKFFPSGWTLQSTLVWGLILAVTLSLGSDLYVKFLQPVVRTLLNH